jgi:hypothetical protein
MGIMYVVILRAFIDGRRNGGSRADCVDLDIDNDIWAY